MIQHDRNFDGLADHFEKRIKLSKKGQLRDRILWQHLNQQLDQIKQGQPLRVLDAAGGLGYMSAALAELGHQVVLNDISKQMLDKAQLYLQPLEHKTNVSLNHGSIQEFCLSNKQSFDLILCHALVEWLAQPQQTLQLLIQQLKPGGVLSLAYYNRNVLVYQNALKGNVDYLIPNKTKRRAKRKGLSPPNAQYPDTINQWFTQWPMQEIDTCGIRVLADWLPKSVFESRSLDELVAMELHYYKSQPYLHSGRYIHSLYRKQ